MRMPSRTSVRASTVTASMTAPPKATSHRSSSPAKAGDPVIGVLSELHRRWLLDAPLSRGMTIQKIVFTSLLAGLRVLHLDRGEIAGDGEIAVVEEERAGDAVLIGLEADGVDRRLLAALVGAVE